MASVSGLRISVPGAVFSRNVGQVAYPILAGLQALFYFGGSEALTVANRAPAKPDGVMSGVPYAYFDGYVQFHGYLSHLQTATLDTTNDLTLIVVVRSVANVAPMISNYDTTGGSTEVGLGGLGLVNATISSDVGPSSVVAEIATAGRFAFIACTVSGTAMSLTVSGADGVLRTTNRVGAFQRVLNVGVPFRVGSGYRADVPASVQDISVAAIHSTALSADQLSQAYQYLKMRLAKQGIAL